MNNFFIFFLLFCVQIKNFEMILKNVLTITQRNSLYLSLLGGA